MIIDIDTIDNKIYLAELDKTLGSLKSCSTPGDDNIQYTTQRVVHSAPLLFILFINDLPLPHTNQIKISQYADDIAFWKSSKSNKPAEISLQQYLHEINTWCTDWFIKINAAESQLILLHREKTTPTIKLKLDNDYIPLCYMAKFPGITFDTNLTWNAHFNNIRKTIFTKANVLRGLTLRT